MSRKYKFTDQDKLYFVSFAVINWIDLFIRKQYKDIVVSSLAYCQQEKQLELYGWCIMTSHIHLIIGTSGNPMQTFSEILRGILQKLYIQALSRTIQKAGVSGYCG